MTMTKKMAYIGDNLQHQSHSLTFLLKNISPFLTASIIYQRTNVMTHTTAASLEKFNGTGFLDIGESKDRFCCFSRSQTDSIYLL